MAKNAEESNVPDSPGSEEFETPISFEKAGSSTSSEETIAQKAQHIFAKNGIDDKELVWRKEPGSNDATSSSSSPETEEHESYFESTLYHRCQNLKRSSSCEAVPMAIDTCEDLWTRLHSISINGCVIEYTGRGKSIYDNGLAQSNAPLTPMNHYYEVTIIQSGENCYIAVGLARKDYPSHKHPGWNRGSIAYHADDGKIFIGSGIGTPFGPRCCSNDVLGCGIVFPSHIQSSYFSQINGKDDGLEGQANFPRSSKCCNMDNDVLLDTSSESEDDIWWNNKNQVYEDKVQVFFMRNGRLLGMKEIRIPKGGFYPTIGMMSRNEKVMIDMNPLTG